MLKRKLLKKFISDIKLPVSPIDLDSYWDRVFKFFPGSKEKLERFQDEISEDPDKWISKSEFLRGALIESFKQNEKYKEFVSSSMASWEVPQISGAYSKSIYEIVANEDLEGVKFLSIDLKEANFQVLKRIGVYSDETWKDLLSKRTESEHIKNSKYFRSVVYGNLNVGRIQTVEKYMINEVREFLETAKVLPENYQLLSRMPDELVYKIQGEIGEFDCRELELAVEEKLGTRVKINHYTLKHQYLQSKSNPGRKIKFFSKHYIEKNEYELVCLGAPYCLIANVLWKGEEIKKEDKLYLNQEGFMCEILDDFEIKEGL